MVSESSFCPDTALTVCECVCVWVWVCGGVGGGWELVYSSHTLLWVLSTGEEKTAYKPETWQSESAAHWRWVFSGIKILAVCSLELSGETRGTTASGLWSITVAISPVCRNRLNQISIICKCPVSLRIKLPEKWSCLYTSYRSVFVEGECFCTRVSSSQSTPRYARHEALGRIKAFKPQPVAVTHNIIQFWRGFVWSQGNIKWADPQGEELSEGLSANQPCSLAELRLIGLSGQLGTRGQKSHLHTHAYTHTQLFCTCSD